MLLEFLKYVVPSALAMCVSSLYTIIDGIFVGRGVGDNALAAVTVVLPITIMLFGITTMFAVGGGALVSKNIGSNNNKEALKIFRVIVKFLFALSLVVSIFFIVFANPIVKIMGATDNLVELSSEYLKYYSLFCIPNLMGITLNSFLRNDGEPNLAMISTVSGAITNIILDYLFIFKFNFGIKGAAIATGLGQIITVLIIIPHFIGKKGILKFGNEKLESIIIKQSTSIGFPSFLAEAAFSVIIFLYNLFIIKVAGEMALTAYSVINYITTNIYMILLGLTFGIQPLISYNFGARKPKKMLKILKLGFISGILINIIYFIVCLIFGYSIIGTFTHDFRIMKLAYNGLILNNTAFFIIGLNLATTVYYQAIEKPKYSNMIGLFRSIIFLPIILLIFSKKWGLNGIWIAMTFSEIMTFISINCIVRLKSATYSGVEELLEKEKLDALI